MSLDLKALLPSLLPKAIQWAESQAALIYAKGTPLPEQLIADAHDVGVQHPERIRVLHVASIPAPDDPLLALAAIQAGLSGPDLIGLTLHYGIFLRQSVGWNRSLVRHECRHVYQCERAGSLASFLPTYLGQIVAVGYAQSPLERDARAYELPPRT